MPALSTPLQHSPLVPTSVALSNVFHPVQRRVLAVVENKASCNYRWWLRLLWFLPLFSALKVATCRYTIKGCPGGFWVSEQRPSFLWRFRFHLAQWLLTYNILQIVESKNAKTCRPIPNPCCHPETFSGDYTLHVDIKYPQKWKINLYILLYFTKNKNYTVKLPYCRT
jgi:hypothetical protein